ncbi:venom allergen 3 homolog [Wyeomyia smithii]|uniref:venom allergen 3 homolog n=1 Tax=Wyeomyia smithii TaxID=174621 RepID=UPI0024681505|nr:venom allergen 3 homolog [Wyeomyia smithii]
MKILVAVSLLVLAKFSHQQTDFCSSTLCSAGTTHIACNGLTGLSPSCGPDAVELNLDSTLQALILDLHNDYRSTIATGNQNYASNSYYPQAQRMATMVWSNELAAVAAANARRCVFGHDQCRNTDDFRVAGQNIASKSYYGMTISVNELIKGFVDAWYSEYVYANPSYIASYPQDYTGPAIGHFTQVVADRATHIGCSMVTYHESPWINQLFVCNYAITNIIGQPVYQIGNYCSMCTTGCNPHYPGLCNIGEAINPNPW